MRSSGRKSTKWRTDLPQIDADRRSHDQQINDLPLVAPPNPIRSLVSQMRSIAHQLMCCRGHGAADTAPLQVGATADRPQLRKLMSALPRATRRTALSQTRPLRLGRRSIEPELFAGR